MSLDASSFNKYAKSSIGTETRGKTTPNRLRRVDHFVTMYCPQLIMSADDFYADVGYGRSPVTTLESARRFRRYNVQLQVLGVEIDARRVREAQQFDDELTRFRQGGFNLPLQTNTVTGRRETVNLIRAFNVLRQYELESDCRDAHVLMSHYLNVHGLLIEGTSDPLGRIWTANVIRKQADHSLAIEALVFSTNFRDGFDIVAFQQVLPKNFIHRMTGATEMIFNFIEDWKISFEQAGKAMKQTFGSGIRQQFVVTAQHLAETYGYNIITEKKYLNRGFLVWLLKEGTKGVDAQQIAYRSRGQKRK
jgi:hypothetical protein